jgi:hypothetical protein
LEEERQIRAIPGGIFKKALDEGAAVIPGFVMGDAEHRSNPANGDGLLIEHPGQIVPLRAGEHVVALHQRESASVLERPRGLCLSRVELHERVTAQTAM